MHARLRIGRVGAGSVMEHTRVSDDDTVARALDNLGQLRCVVRSHVDGGRPGVRPINKVMPRPSSDFVLRPVLSGKDPTRYVLVVEGRIAGREVAAGPDGHAKIATGAKDNFVIPVHDELGVNI